MNLVMQRPLLASQGSTSGVFETACAGQLFGMTRASNGYSHDTYAVTEGTAFSEDEVNR